VFKALQRTRVVERGETTRQRELREALRLFLENGAPIRAAEVARELGLVAAS
jgi:hypothetical protein